MTVTKKGKGKTAIVVPGGMHKAGLATKKTAATNRKIIQELADNLSASAWEKIKQQYNFKWLQ
jgi:hypothetical protein